MSDQAPHYHYRWLWTGAALLAGGIQPAWAAAPDFQQQLTGIWIPAAAYGFTLIAAFSKNHHK